MSDLTERLAEALEVCEASMARAWDEGRRAEQEYRARQDDADAAGQYVQINLPRNPYREASQQACSCDLSGMAPPAVHIVDNHATTARTGYPAALKALQAVLAIETEPISGSLMGYEIDQAEGWNEAVRHVRAVITEHLGATP